MLHVSNEDAGFLLARTIAGLIFLALLGWFAGRSSRAEEASVWLRYVFLTVAWFWLLSPAQNPWYWLWALPFIPYARCWTWLSVSGLALIYYLRFWLMYHWPNAQVMFDMNGTTFFDHAIVWLEFGPWFVCLFAEWLLRQTCYRSDIK